MFGRRKNRRKVDVAAHQARARAVARGAFAGLLWAMLAALLVTGAGWAGLEGWSWLTTTPRLAVAHIAFTGLGNATEEELLRLSGLRLGQNIVTADLGQAAQAMRLHPWVQEVKIERLLPRTVRVEIAEHRPAALLALGGLYLVDAAGAPFRRALPGDALDLPVITGLERESFVDGRAPSAGSGLREALALLDAWRAGGLEKRWPASEVRVEQDLGLTLVASDGAEVQVGLGDYAVKLRRLALVRTELARSGQRAARVDLSSRRPGWVAVQLQ